MALSSARSTRPAPPSPRQPRSEKSSKNSAAATERWQSQQYRQEWTSSTTSACSSPSASSRAQLIDTQPKAGHEKIPQRPGSHPRRQFPPHRRLRRLLYRDGRLDRAASRIKEILYPLNPSKPRTQPSPIDSPSHMKLESSSPNRRRPAASSWTTFANLRLADGQLDRAHRELLDLNQTGRAGPRKLNDERKALMRREKTRRPRPAIAASASVRASKTVYHFMKLYREAVKRYSCLEDAR